MRKLKFLLTIILMAALSACSAEEIPDVTLPDPPVSEPAESNGRETDETETPAEREDPSETPGIDPQEPEPSETPGIDPSKTEPDEVTIVLGEDTAQGTDTDHGDNERDPDGTDDGVIRMLIPSDYAQVRGALTKINWYGYTYEEAIRKGITETMAAETIPEVEAPEMAPQPDFAEQDPAEEPGRIYTEEELYSKTNTQVAEIDEGDIVKTDGEYIYVLRDSEELLILSADGKDTRVLSRTMLTEILEPDEDSIPVSQNAVELYIYNDRAAVIGSENFWDETHWSNKTYIDFYDISDPMAPVYLKTLGQDGSYETSRMIDGHLWLITRFGIALDDIAEVRDYESYIPGLFDGKEQNLVEPECIVYPEKFDLAVYTVITAADMKSCSRTECKSVLGISPSTVYVSGSSIYLAQSVWYEEKSEPRTESVYTVVDHTTGTRTRLMRMDITDGIRTAAYTEIPGRLLNQFSMDEYGGHLRLVTTVDEQYYTVYTDESAGFVNTKYHADKQANALYILDGDLNLTGKIEDLSPDERVQSVRFTGNTGYFVTFRQVDPLFTADLTDAANPVILHELKIPGFSQYLHPWSSGLLLGLGQDGDDNGLSGKMKLSMFDVTDPHAVSETAKLALEFGYSEALTNHRAILVSSARNLIGFPADRGYAVYGFNGEKKFFERAYIEMEGKWSGRSRGLFVGDDLYILMEKGCTVLDLNTFGVLKTVKY